jgi:hypothetical protein
VWLNRLGRPCRREERGSHRGPVPGVSGASSAARKCHVRATPSPMIEACSPSAGSAMPLLPVTPPMQASPCHPVHRASNTAKHRPARRPDRPQCDACLVSIRPGSRQRVERRHRNHQLAGVIAA